jgi:hypothetical protein
LISAAAYGVVNGKDKLQTELRDTLKAQLTQASERTEQSWNA